MMFDEKKQMIYTNSSCIRTLHYTHTHAQCRDLVVTQSGDDARGDYCKYIRHQGGRDKTVLPVLSLRGVRYIVISLHRYIGTSLYLSSPNWLLVTNLRVFITTKGPLGLRTT